MSRPTDPPLEPPVPAAAAMSARRVAVTLVLGLAGASGAFWLSMQRHLPRDASFGVPLEPGLAGRLTDVDRIRIREGGTVRVTLERRAGHFVVLERAGYAADAHAVRDLLASLADLKRVAPIGRARDAPGRGAPDTVSVELEGRLPPLAFDLGAAAGPDTRYVRTRAAGLVEAGPAPTVALDPGAWLRHEVIDLRPAEVRRLVFERGALGVALERAAPDAPFALAAGRGATPPALAGTPADLLEHLTLEDVRAVGAGAAGATPSDPVAVTRVETFAGLVVECRGHTDGARHWLRVAARYLPGGAATAEEADRARAAAARLGAMEQGYEVDIPADRYARLFPGAFSGEAR